MVLRYWGAQGLDSESFASLVDRSAGGISTAALTADVRRRGWNALALGGNVELLRAQLDRGRPVIALVEDRPGTFHYIVVVGWHERGVVFHDPAAAPFRVMTTAVFERRWAASDRWMLVVTPGSVTSDGAAPPSAASDGATSRETPSAELFPRVDPEGGRESDRRRSGGAAECGALIADGVRAAQGNQLDVAERTLAMALACPGTAAMRELAGVRVLQRRWPEASDLAAAAVEQDPSDAYAWKLLATARFIGGQTDAALDAWNRGGEPRLDLIRVDGLVRTRQRPVEQLLGLKRGALLTAGALARARRQLAELPASRSTSLEYAPRASGLAELSAAVVERPLFPSGLFTLVTAGVTAVASREVSVLFASPTGGGERVVLGWRFWEGRPKYALDLRAPAPWGGVWGLAAFAERQPFTDPAEQVARRKSMELSISRWVSARVRLEAAGGIERRRERDTFGALRGGVRFASRDDRIDAALAVQSWSGSTRFATLRATARGRTSAALLGPVLQVRGTFEGVSIATPLDLWAAGDVGRARPSLLRAHPVLERGRLRVDRLGRAIIGGTLEGQYWWRVGPLRLASAAFVDLARTSRRTKGEAIGDVDAGAGIRLSAPGVPGMLRIDVARSLSDTASALSFVLVVE